MPNVRQKYYKNKTVLSILKTIKDNYINNSNQISRVVGCSQANVYVFLKRLEKDGYIRFNENIKLNHNEKVAILTEKGFKLLALADSYKICFDIFKKIDYDYDKLMVD